MLSAAISSLLSGVGAIDGPVARERNAHVSPARKTRVRPLTAAPAERMLSGLTQRILSRQEMQDFGGASWRAAEIANLCAHR